MSLAKKYSALISLLVFKTWSWEKIKDFIEDVKDEPFLCPVTAELSRLGDMILPQYRCRKSFNRIMGIRAGLVIMGWGNECGVGQKREGRTVSSVHFVKCDLKGQKVDLHPWHRLLRVAFPQ